MSRLTRQLDHAVFSGDDLGDVPQPQIDFMKAAVARNLEHED